MEPTATDAARKWRRRLALGYWSLSPLLFGIVVRSFLIPLDILQAYTDAKPLAAWPRELAIAYAAGVCLAAAAAMWALWTRVRRLPPPVGS